MSRYLLDTSTLIDFSKGRQPVESRLLALIAAKETIAVSAISVAEFYAGIPPALHEQWRQFFAALDYWNASHDAAIQAGRFIFDYARQGRVLSTTAALLAAVALEHDAVVVTDNAKDFPMPEVQLLSLRAEQ
ncbi:MAG TPA: PIN domain-containing protein [Thermomicrobiaceae bacterium]|nr:PIN domain-containing protein [Thermomicrobiaceae bacterium]